MQTIKDTRKPIKAYNSGSLEELLRSDTDVYKWLKTATAEEIKRVTEIALNKCSFGGR